MISLWLGIIALLAGAILSVTGLRRKGTHIFEKKQNLIQICLLSLVSLLSLGFYLWLGNPSGVVEREALFQKTQQLKAALGDQQIREALVSQIQAKLSQNPEDLMGWFLLGKLTRSLNKFSQSEQAFGKAHELAPHERGITLEYVQALLLAHQKPPAEVFHLLELLLSESSNDGASLNLMAFAEWESGHVQVALRYWKRALPQFLPGSPEYRQIQEMIQKVS